MKHSELGFDPWKAKGSDIGIEHQRATLARQLSGNRTFLTLICKILHQRATS